jgi:hypothetical protein
MRKYLIALTIAFLLLTTLSASASAPAPGPFSTTGYTTNLVAIEGYPYPLPTEYAFLPNGYVKFHIRAQGGPAYADDSLCQQFYGVTSCEELCTPFGEACGAHGSFEGSFAFDEWGILDSTGAGANDGLLTVTTRGGRTGMRFGGAADATAVSGSFQFLGGPRDMKKASGGGLYAGNSGYAFKVVYTPCGSDGRPGGRGEQPTGHDGQLACPAPLCATHRQALKLRDSKATWLVVNDGKEPARLDSLLLYWPEQNGALTSVRLGGKTLATGSWPAPYVQLDLTGAPSRDRQIRGTKDGIITLQFESKRISEKPADYTLQAGFANGCSAIHVAFP